MVVIAAIKHAAGGMAVVADPIIAIPAVAIAAGGSADPVTFAGVVLLLVVVTRFVSPAVPGYWSLSFFGAGSEASASPSAAAVTERQTTAP